MGIGNRDRKKRESKRPFCVLREKYPLFGFCTLHEGIQSSRMNHVSSPAQVRLSKSKFVTGIQCMKRLYYQIHQPELAGPTDESQEARLEQGNEVGLLAQSRFPRGVLVGFEG